MKNNLLELITAAILIALTVVVLNPTHLFMPTMVLSILLVGTFAIFCAFAVFVVRERAGDERESAHRASSGRVAFLLGSAVLVLGIIKEGMTHVVDEWLVLALVAMVLSKICTRVYSDYWL